MTLRWYVKKKGKFWNAGKWSDIPASYDLQDALYFRSMLNAVIIPTEE